MIKKEDIKVGLRFYITKNDCLKCNFDPIGIQSGSTPILCSMPRERMLMFIYVHLLAQITSISLVFARKIL